MNDLANDTPIGGRFIGYDGRGLVPTNSSQNDVSREAVAFERRSTRQLHPMITKRSKVAN
jgi:hypothetical protein